MSERMRSERESDGPPEPSSKLIENVARELLMAEVPNVCGGFGGDFMTEERISIMIDREYGHSNEAVKRKVDEIIEKAGGPEAVLEAAIAARNARS